MSRAPTLAALLDGLAIVPGAEHVEVGGLCLDSRAAQPGDVFIALAGTSAHGITHAGTALERGAVAVLFEPPLPEGLQAPAGAHAVPGLRSVLGTLAARFHGDPSRAVEVIGVTGTNGKTSTVQLLSQALNLGGAVAGSIGTLGAGLHGQVVAGERTTPDVLAVHRLIAQMRDAGATHIAMEVSSHALDQGRVDAVAFRVAVFTNLSRDHLDYHGDMETYGAVKARLFQVPGLAAAVINLDDAHGRRIHASLPDALARFGVSSHGQPEAALRAERVQPDNAGIGFDLVEGENCARVQSPLLGRFNVDNLLAVAGVLRALGRGLEETAALLGRLQPVHGRMTRLGGERGQPLVVIDYAHTPDALEQALGALRDHALGLVVCVFGCGGERDRGKRPQMAAVAERLAERVVVTDDNPRNEDGDRIVEEILAGFAEPGRVRVERDRGRAIAGAIAEAGANDIVLIAGKGHEPYQETGGVRLEFDDVQTARQVLEGRA